MTNTPCPECGCQASDEARACPQCGHALTNGTAPLPKKPYQKPPLPPELEGVVFEKVTPEIEKLLGPFNLEEYLAGVREIEAGGGHRFEDFIDEIERIANGKE